MKFIQPKNWKEFQHYKDRAPAWIKLHKRLLDDYEFHCLHAASKALAPCLWLLASEYERGEIPLDKEKIAFRLHLSPEALDDALQPLLSAGFFEIIDGRYQSASKALAGCKRDAIPEKEIQVTSNKKETQEQIETNRACARDEIVSNSFSQSNVQPKVEQPLPPWLPAEPWNAFAEMRRTIRAPLTAIATNLAIAELDKLRAAGHDPAKVLNQSILRSWRGLFPLVPPHANGSPPKRDIGAELLAKWKREEAEEAAKQ